MRSGVRRAHARNALAVPSPMAATFARTSDGSSSRDASISTVERLVSAIHANRPADSSPNAQVSTADRTGAKGKALFHPIRLALTGEPEGVELDLAVPLIERGAALTRQGGPEGPPLHESEIDASGVRRIAGVAERAIAFLHELERTGSNA